MDMVTGIGTRCRTYVMGGGHVRTGRSESGPVYNSDDDGGKSCFSDHGRMWFFVPLILMLTISPCCTLAIRLMRS